MTIKRIGWSGVVDDKLHFEHVTDNYVENFAPGVLAINVYKSRKEAKKRYQEVREIFIKV